MKIFVAGASGAIGRRLVPLLVQAGHEVHGGTRGERGAAVLRALGATPCVADVFDRDALHATLRRSRPDVVIHQLTDLPPGLDPARMGDAIARNARVRSEGTANLVAAALASGCGRMVAQSIAWAYAPGDGARRETDPLDLAAVGARATTVQGVAALEAAVLGTPALAGTVLRYGHLYGPGTGTGQTADPLRVHVDAAASAALLALRPDALGAFNICEPNEQVSPARAVDLLGWSAAFRLPEAAGSAR
ncbi:MAG TPA: NAD-dependent epimerase/dehydratase family protein [Burkholderiaceae bacterium]